MRKGEMRRKTILDAAERLFYTKGYEATSIQDILDELELSKGGFYHHFESKMSLLEAICEAQAGASVQAMQEAVANCPGGAADRLNALFAKGGLYSGERVDFVGLLIRVAYRGEGHILREKMKRATIDGALPLINEIIHAGIEQGAFFCRFPDEIGELLLLLFANLSDEIAQLVASRPDDAAAILGKLEVYRYAMEALLNAPYGSVVVFELERVNQLIRALAEQEHRFDE